MWKSRSSTNGCLIFIERNTLSHFEELLEDKDKAARKQTCWFISNLVLEVEGALAFLERKHMVQKLMSMLQID